VETISLGGLFYKRVGASTLEHDHWLAGHTRQSGSENWKLRKGESHDELGARILSDLMAGRGFLILGGLLMPSDQAVWSIEMARRTAQHLAGLTDPEEKRIANTELLSLVFEFFVNGLACWMTSETSSEATDEPAGTGRAGSSGSGAESSEPSREPTTTPG